MSENESLFTSFMFGNLDESGGLEEDFLDEETKTRLSNLGSFLSSEEAMEEFAADYKNSSNQHDFEISCDQEDDDDDGDESFGDCDTVSKASDAEDFADIDEIIDEAIETSVQTGDEVEMDTNMTNDSDSGSDDDEERPMAGMLPELFRGFDVKLFFPAFRRNKVLRFSRLFGLGKVSSMPRLWKGLKSKRKENHLVQPAAAGSKEPKDENDSASGVQGLQLEYETDDELLLMKPQPPSQRPCKVKGAREESRVAAWRYGPAAYWYDKMGITPSGQGLDSLMKLKPKSSEADVIIMTPDAKERELLLPLNLVRWEDNVIMNAEDVRQEVVAKLTSGKQPLCGWIATQQTRTFESFMTMLRSGGFAHIFGGKSASTTPASNFKTPVVSSDPNSSNFCIFPPDNLDLIYGDWEKEVIIDPKNMDKLPEPKIATVDLCDDPLLYGIPEDMSKEEAVSSAVVPIDDSNSAKLLNDRKDHLFTKKSQVILGKVAQRQREEEEEAANLHSVTDKDAFNLSNDDCYQPKGSSSLTSPNGSMIQHSIPAQNLMQPFFYTYWSVFKLRHFHRLPLKRYSAHRSILARPIFHPVRSLQRHMKDIAAARERDRMASGGGEMFFMRKPEDLNGKDAELIFCEYSEEHPPLLMQPGMATKIKNYYKRKPGKENVEPKFEYGETSYTHTTPFLGNLSPGDALQALDNNLFRSPIYKHHVPATDFLIIRDRNGYYVRDINTLFVVGQECPCYEVPGPNSKRASNFVRDYLMVFIYRLFWQSQDSPRRLKMEDVRRAFPHYAESTIRKRLKICSDFKRLGAGPESNYWVLRPDFRLPSLEEIRSMVTPEMCCAAFSMQAAEQLLKDAGYGERYFFAHEEEEDGGGGGGGAGETETKMVDEIKCAPWNLTRAFLSAMKGKYLLDLTGVADPTGCGEGFSYVRLASKQPREELPAHAKRTVTGTDADLRKLSLKDAKQLLKEFGVKDDEIKTLTRWEIIDVIRTLSTQQARSGGAGVTKFARGNVRYSAAEVHEKYKQDCQRIFDLQNKVLQSAEYLSTDEEESESVDSDVEEMGKNIETMLSSKKAHSRPLMAIDDEQAEREELKRLLLGDSAAAVKKASAKLEDIKDSSTADSSAAAIDEAAASEYVIGGGDSSYPSAFAVALESERRKLKIYRKRLDDNGREFVNVEVVAKPQLIEAYLKIRTTKDEAFIKHFAQMDEQYKEEKRREKRRLQDQLRRIRRNELRAQMGLPLGRPPKPHKPAKPPPPPKPSLLKMKCSACGAAGHMKTNKNCPLYHKWRRSIGRDVDYRQPSGLIVAPTDEQIAEELNELARMDNLTSIEGTKIKLSRAVFERTEKMKKKALRLKFPKHIVQSTTVSALPDRRGRKKKRLEGVQSHEASASDATSAIPENAEQTDESKIADIVKSVVPKAAAGQSVKKSDVLSRRASSLFDQPSTSRDHLLSVSGPTTSASLNKPVVQRRRADPKVTMSIVLEQVLNEMKAAECSRPFLHSVNKKLVPDYYKIVRHAMDLPTIKMNLTRNQYFTRKEFLKDVQLILDNSRLYNGDQHAITQSARELFLVALKGVAEREQKLMKLEKLINPLLDDNDLVAFCFILDRILQDCKRVPKSFIFHHPVDKRKYPAYYDKITTPMDLGTVETKCKRHQYESVNTFIRDIELIYKNCEAFNGPASSFTTKAREIMDTAHKLIGQSAQNLADLEKRIQASKQKLLDDMETESFATGISSMAGDTVVERQADEVSLAAIDEQPSRITTPFCPSSPPVAAEQAEENTTILQNDLLMSDVEEGMDDNSDDEMDLDEERPPMTPGGQFQDEDDLMTMDTVQDTSYGAVRSDEEAQASPMGVSSNDIEALSRGQTPTLADEDSDREHVQQRDALSSNDDADADADLSERLERSSMAQTGRLHSDLAMSSDDETHDADNHRHAERHPFGSSTAPNRHADFDFDDF